MRISAVWYPVSQWEAAKTFYGEVLGLALAQVNDTAGYGVADAKVTATAMDRIKLTQVEAITNAGGRAEFTHLTPGTWHLVVEKEKFERRDLQVTIKKGQQPEFRDLHLKRISF